MTKAAFKKFRIRAELDQVEDALAELKTTAEQSEPDRNGKYYAYLETLEDMHDDVSHKLTVLDDSDRNAVRNIRRGLAETRQRLAIAQQAAAARF